MNVTFVVQRYGREILGGSETLAREVAQRLSKRVSVRVLTSCAQDYVTWENAYEPGETEIDGVRVIRFPVIEPRRHDFDRLSARLYGRSTRTLDEELEWVRAQGPQVPGLLQYLREHRDESDVFIFFTYIYYPTALGLRLVADKALLVPTAHDEPPIYFGIYKSLFHSPRAILYNTEEERRLVQRLFGNEYIPSTIAGVGIEVPENPNPERFRRKLGIRTPYFLYLGRIVSSKGCDELIANFRHYRQTYPGEASLVLLGKTEMSLPQTPEILYGGFVDETDKFDAIAGAEAVIIPSRYESLSIIALEAWGLGKPVVSTAFSPVLYGMGRRSNGGLYYHDTKEFVEILHFLIENKELARTIGRQGRAFVARTYNWQSVEDSYHRMIDYVAEGVWQ